MIYIIYLSPIKCMYIALCCILLCVCAVSYTHLPINKINRLIQLQMKRDLLRLIQMLLGRGGLFSHILFKEGLEY